MKIKEEMFDFLEIWGRRSMERFVKKVKNCLIF
jgi:hypothetical protein